MPQAQSKQSQSHPAREFSSMATPHHLSKQHSKVDSHSQPQAYTFGCGLQFREGKFKYPQTETLDRYFPSKPDQPVQSRTSARASGPASQLPSEPSSNTGQIFATVRREISQSSDGNNRKSARGAHSDPLSTWQHMSDRDMPWNGVGAVALSNRGESCKQGRLIRIASSVDTVRGSSGRADFEDKGNF